MVHIENLLGLVIFLIFILSRLFGQKNPPPPRRGQRPPAQTQEPTTIEPGPTRAETRSPVEEAPAPLSRRKQPEDEFFPIPDDLREIFGLPPVEKEEVKPKPKPVMSRPEPEPVQMRESRRDETRKPREETTIGEISSDFNRESTAYRSTGRKTVVIPGIGSLDKSSVIQGVIWAEVLNNPRTRRARRFPGRI